LLPAAGDIVVALFGFCIKVHRVAHHRAQFSSRSIAAFRAKKAHLGRKFAAG
jgi:hypothetical protein